MCDLKGYHSDNVKILKIIEWSSCALIAEVKAFIKVCMYYWIWILKFVHIAVLIYYLFWDGILFEWVRCQQKAINLLKEQLTTASALKSINYYKDVSDIVFVIDANGHEWGAVLMQYAAELNWKWHPIRYESGVWSPQEAAYDVRWKKCKEILLALKKLWFWLYKVHFVFKVNVNTLVTQLNQAVINLSGTFII